MSENESTQQRQADEISYEPKGVVDLPSVLYVVCGIPCMALFFLILFSLTGSCDSMNVMVPA